MLIRQLLILSLFACLGLGCVKENYRRPAIDVPQHWDKKDAFAQQDSKTPLCLIQWWQDFDDPTLNTLIELGFKNNTQLHVSYGRIQAALGELKKIRNQWIPNLTLFTGYLHNPAFGNPGNVIVLLPSYFINFYQQWHEYKISRMQLAQTRAEDDMIRLTLISEIASSYFNYQAQRDYLRLLKQLKNDVAYKANISERMNKDGLIPDIETHAIFDEVYQIDAEIQTTKRNIDYARNALRYLINQNPGPIITSCDFKQLLKKPKVVEATPMCVLLNRPDMKLVEYRLRAAFYNVKLARSPFLPTFELDAYPGLFAGNNSYGMPRYWSKLNNQVIKVSIFKWTALGEIDKAKGERKAIFHQFVDTLRVALKNTENAYINHDRSSKKLQQIEKATQQRQVVFNRNQQLTCQGIQSEFELLNSKIAYDRALLNLNQAQLLQLQSLVGLYQELGGGYRSKSLKVCHKKAI